MSDECKILTYDYSTVLPVNSESPAEFDFFVSLTFYCNGQTFVSPFFSNTGDLLEWAQENLGGFGNWSLNGNEISVTETTCRQSGIIFTVGQPITRGCTIPTALNYNQYANVSDFSCQFPPNNTPNYIDPICDQFTVTSDIPYSPSNPTLLADSYVETCNVNTNRPVFVFLHGGGGKKTNLGAIRWCQDFASRGYYAFSIEYGQTGDANENGFTLSLQKDAIANTCAFVRWVRANAVALGINPDNIFLKGESAGALTAMGTGMVAYALDDGTFLIGYAVNLENPTESSVPTATATGAGASTNTFIAKLSATKSVANFFANGYLDCHIAYSIAKCISDCPVPNSACVSGALDTYQAFIAAGITNATFVKYPTLGHGLGSAHDDILANNVVSGVTPFGGEILGSNGISTGMIYQFANLLSP